MRQCDFAYFGDSFHYLESSRGFPINLILSPAFYYYFKEPMPVTSASKAKKLAPGVLEGRIPEGDYTFYVFPTSEKMVFEIIAFDRGLFESALKDSKIPKDRIKNLSFASLEFKEEFLISYEDRIIGSKEGYFFDIEASLLPLKESGTKSFEELFKNRDRLNFRISYGKRNALERAYEFIESNYLLISASFILLALSFIFLSISTFGAISDIDAKKSELSSSLANMSEVQLKYLKGEYEELHKSQKRIRDRFDKILSLEGSAKAYLSSLSFSANEGWRLSVRAKDRTLSEKFVAPVGGQFIDKKKDIYIYKVSK